MLETQLYSTLKNPSFPRKGIGLLNLFESFSKNPYLYLVYESVKVFSSNDETNKGSI